MTIFLQYKTRRWSISVDIQPISNSDLRPRLCSGLVILVIDKLSLEGAEEALHRSVDPAVALATHALMKSIAFQHISVFLSGVLNALVGMQDDVSRRMLPSYRLMQGINHRLLCHPLIHCLHGLPFRLL